MCVYLFIFLQGGHVTAIQLFIDRMPFGSCPRRNVTDRIELGRDEAQTERKRDKHMRYL